MLTRAQPNKQTNQSKMHAKITETNIQEDFRFIHLRLPSRQTTHCIYSSPLLILCISSSTSKIVLALQAWVLHES